MPAWVRMHPHASALRAAGGSAPDALTRWPGSSAPAVRRNRHESMRLRLRACAPLPDHNLEVTAMKTMMLALALVLSLVAGCSRAGGDTAEKVFADMSANMHEMSAILASVTDEASARAAVPRIDAVRAKMRECATRARAVPKPDAAAEQKLDAASVAMQREIMPALLADRQRLQARPELMAILAPALQGMENDL